VFEPPLNVPRRMLRSRDDERWRRKVTAVMRRFQSTFLDIAYDVAWEVDAFNGVAWRQISQRHVRLYGGLLRHRAIGLEAIALLFAHETGHHFGGPPRDRIYTWMTTERQADVWAAHAGIKAVWAGDDEGAKRQIFLGAKQVLAFELGMMKLADEEHKREQLSRGRDDHPLPSERFEIYMGALR
jgi:hypothetical protein